MAEKTELDSRPNQVPKDVQGSNNAIPLSPQWLLPKPGEIKTGPVMAENHFSPFPSNANRLASVKPTGAGDDLIDNSKKKDVFRPSVLDMESGRRDRWRDEERDTNSSARKDRWREGEREHVDNNRRVDRSQRVDSSVKPYGETRRAPGDRWTDSGNKDNNRESKWNSRWGHDDKETGAVREKWGDSNKEDDVLLDKGPSQVPSHAKDERDGDHYRPWRPNSSFSRGRADPHHQTLTPDKHVPTLSHGRGRGENLAPVYSHGRGRARSGGNSITHMANHLQPHGPLIERGESGYGELGPLNYSRTKLIDIYRTTDMMSFSEYTEALVQVPSLTQEAPIEPLSVCAPTPEELVILKGIEKGEIIGSGAPQVSKDGSAGRTTADFMQSRRSNIDDFKHDTVDNPDGYSEGLVHEKNGHRWTNAKVGLNNEDFKEDISAARESITPGTWRSSSVAERSRLMSDRRELNMDTPKGPNNMWQNSTIGSPNTKSGAPKWQVGDDTVMRRQPPSAMNRDMEPPIISHPSPEDLVLYYKDPQGEIQGPFSGSDIITWFESGYFGIELHVRLAGAPAESPFSLLGDVMPHLRAKARPPPGFKTPKANETQDTAGIPSFTSFGKLHAVASESDVLKNDPRYQHGIGSATEAENRYLESLMAGSLSTAPFDKFVFSEGMQSYVRPNFTSQTPLVSNSGDDPYLLAQKLASERQKSIPNPYSHWPGRDAASVTSNTDVINDASLGRAQHHPQTVEALPVNNAISGWTNFPTQGGDKLDIRHTQNVPPQSSLGIMQQQRLQPQNPSLSNLLAQSLDNSSRIPNTEHILTSGIPQDQQILSLLQQQFLLQQVQSQAPVPSQQLSLLDMMLKQQQKQEEQQQLMRQQQQLLSQVLSDRHPNQPPSELPFGQLQSGGVAAGNANVDHTRFQQHHDIFQMGQQVQAATGVRDESANNANFVMPPRDSQDVSRNMGSENSGISMHLPHQMFVNTPKQKTLDASSAEQIVEQTKRISGSTDGIDTISKYDESVKVQTTTDIASSFSGKEHLKESVPQKQFTANIKNETNIHETAAGALAEPRDMEEQLIVDSSVIKQVKNSESREVKKASEKKSRKQKSSKVSTEPVKAASNSQELNFSESEGTVSGNTKSETLEASVAEKEKMKIKKVAGDVGFPPGQSSLPVVNYPADVVMETNAQPGQVAHTSQVGIQANAGQRAWKPAPGFKPKSFLEIQQEEQRRAQEEQKRAQEDAAVSDISTSLKSVSVSTPWAGLVVNSDHKALEEIRQKASSVEINLAKSDSFSNLKNKKIQHEEQLWVSSVDKLSDRDMETSNHVASLTSIMSSQTDSIFDDDFIDAKESKKSRKKSAKAKNAGAKASLATGSDVYVGSSTNDKGKHARQVQQQKEVLPALPSGPSLGDFVTWKEEPASPPAPAWPESGKPNKAASIRDILKEQGKKVSSPLPVLTPQKPATNQPARSSGPSWSYSSSPAKAASPLTINQQASSQPKHKVEDDLFWGPLEQPKSEDKQLEFPQLTTQGSWGSKNIPVKGNTGGTTNRHNSTGVKPADYSLPKGKKNIVTKNSEAVDFKEWCESECIRLIGSKDTSILEYCLKISRSEAEILLTENLGSFDPNREFIDKFLSYKDFLPTDVVEIAFKNRSDQKKNSSGAGDVISNHVNVGGSNPGSAGASAIDGATKAGKKKGKKGKKVCASVLGFNVVSNRIMMGEIQTVDE